MARGKNTLALNEIIESPKSDEKDKAVAQEKLTIIEKIPINTNKEDNHIELNKYLIINQHIATAYSILSNKKRAMETIIGAINKVIEYHDTHIINTPQKM